MQAELKKITAAILALWSSRKLWMSITAVAIMWGIYWHTAYHITKLANDLPADKIGVLLPILNDMYQVMMYGVVTIAVGYTGFQTLQGFTRNSTGSVIATAKALFSESKETRNITVTENVDPEVVKLFTARYREDPSYRPIQPDIEEAFR
jgi:vancomycin permeability regulator SanA